MKILYSLIFKVLKQKYIKILDNDEF